MQVSPIVMHSKIFFVDILLVLVLTSNKEARENVTNLLTCFPHYIQL